MVINSEIDKKLKDLVIDYKCLGAYSNVEEMVVSMDCNCSAFKEVCRIMKNEDKSFEKAQHEVLMKLQGEITYIVINELYYSI